MTSGNPTDNRKAQIRPPKRKHRSHEEQTPRKEMCRSTPEKHPPEGMESPPRAQEGHHHTSDLVQIRHRSMEITSPDTDGHHHTTEGMNRPPETGIPRSSTLRKRNAQHLRKGNPTERNEIPILQKEKGNHPPRQETAEPQTGATPIKSGSSSFR